MAALCFRQTGEGETDLLVEDAAGGTIASTSASCAGNLKSWLVAHPAGQNYRVKQLH